MNGIVMDTMQIMKRAVQLAQNFLILDTHIDTPYHLKEQWIDLSKPGNLHFNYPAAVQGGLNAVFMAVYTSPSYQENGAKEFADSLVDIILKIEQAWPDLFAICATPDEIRNCAASEKIALAMGMENGAPLEGNLENLRYFFERGIRYITLTHSEWNHICDSSYDPDKHWNGLSPFGEKLIPEMNRLGMMIDISHVSDATYYQVLELSEAPVIASHSACRHFTPDFERNMSDKMIRILAERKGIIQMNFGSLFVNNGHRIASDVMAEALEDHLKSNGYETRSDEAHKFVEQYRKSHQIPEATVAGVADHVDHIVELVGIDYVGIGSDFDGVPSVPVGLEDVSGYPNLIAELLRRKYTEQDIRKICGENFLRVWSQIIQYSRQ